MILNNGRFEVDTMQADFLGKSQRRYMSYSYEASQYEVYTAYRSRRNPNFYFLVLYYEGMFTKLLQKLGKAGRKGHVLVTVSSDLNAFRDECERREIEFDVPLPRPWYTKV